MADVGKIIGAIVGRFKDLPGAVQSAGELYSAARDVFDILGRKPDEITDADLDRLAEASDAAHAEVQEPLEDEEE